MKPKILVTRKMTNEAEKKIAENFEVTFNKNDDPIPYEELILSYPSIYNKILFCASRRNI